MMNLKMALRVAFFATLLSCSQSQKTINSRPERDQQLGASDYIRLVISATDGLSKTTAPFTTPPFFNNQLKVGGDQTRSKYLQIIRETYPDNHLLLGLGDNLSQNDEIQKRKNFLDKTHYDALAFNRLDYWNYSGAYNSLPFIVSNVSAIKNSPYKDSRFSPYLLTEKKGINIAIFSMKSKPSQENQEFIGLYFEDPVLSVVKAYKELKEKNTHLVILMTNIESNCHQSKSGKSHKIGYSLNYRCPKNDPISELIKRLPPTLDYLIYSKTKGESSMGFINKIPIVQIKNDGRSLLMTDLYFNKTTKKMIQHKTNIHAPVELCHFFIPTFNDCFISSKERQGFIRERAGSYRQMAPAFFLGRQIH